LSDNFPFPHKEFPEMTTIDLTIHKDRRARAIQRARERDIVIPK
jgi:hypothetical protein